MIGITISFDWLIVYCLFRLSVVDLIAWLVLLFFCIVGFVVGLVYVVC